MTHTRTHIHREVEGGIRLWQKFNKFTYNIYTRSYVVMYVKHRRSNTASANRGEKGERGVEKEYSEIGRGRERERERQAEEVSCRAKRLHAYRWPALCCVVC